MKNSDGLQTNSMRTFARSSKSDMIVLSVQLIVEKAGLSNHVGPPHLVVEAREANGWLAQDDSRRALTLIISAHLLLG